MHVLIHKIIMLFKKKKKKVYNKDPCEFSYLYRTAPPKSLLEAPQPRNLRKTYHQP